MNLQDFALDFWMCLKLFVASCDIYVVIWDPLYVKNKKRIYLVTLPCARDKAHGKVTIWPALDTKFTVCLGRAHDELTIVRRVPLVRAHGKSGSVAVCLPSGHTANLGALPCPCRPGTRRTAADAVSWP